MVASGPPGTPVPFVSCHFQNRVIKERDRISILIEVNGPGGFYMEIGRIFSVREPPQKLLDTFGVSLEAQELSLSLLKPGADPKEIIGCVLTHQERTQMNLLIINKVDYFINVVPFTHEKEKMIGARGFSAMKPTAFFISVGRGNTVDENLRRFLQGERCNLINAIGWKMAVFPA